MTFPVEWTKGTTKCNMVHLLRYSFLFPPAVLISYFRAINYSAMKKAFQLAQVNMEMLKKLSYESKGVNRGRGRIRLVDRLEPSTNRYLVLNIRRHNILEDAMNQLWRRQPGELMKPLRVCIGREEGEEGVDLGGIQQEFFRLAIAEAMDPKYGEHSLWQLLTNRPANDVFTGAFTTDATTRMTWFQPHSLEPLYMFEMVGLLTSLAVYNGLTVPFTFPKALYRRMCSLPCENLHDIEDGWPDLARGLRALLDWTDGDVGDVFVRRYTFSVDVFGTIVDTDMDVKKRHRDMNSKESPHKSRQSTGDLYNEDSAPHPDGYPPNQSSPSLSSLSLSSSSSSSSSTTSDNSTPMVTNANRHAFVRDYIIHLTDISIQPQLAAFLTGFRRCLTPKSLQLFDPDSLKLLIEGHTLISTHDLEAIATYDSAEDDLENNINIDMGYYYSHPTIRQFWEIVHGWGDGDGDAAADAAAGRDDTNTNTEANAEAEAGQRKIRALLEFVTASDRLPVHGLLPPNNESRSHSRLQFVIQKNGSGDDRLPSSMTCFGRLLLPQYSGIEPMRKALERAVEEGKGFGLP